MRIPVKDRSALVEAALGKRPMDLIIRNVKVVNVFTGEIYPGEIGIYDGFIAHIEANPDNIEKSGQYPPMEGKEEFDGQGMYAIPGFVDCHVHIESSMMTPANFTKTILPNGTTTVVTDPHEIGNVLGMEGVKYMADASSGLPMRQFILVPSCVPAVPGSETGGAEFGPEEIDEMLSWDRVLGLAEVMDFPGVIYGSPRMRGILEKAEKRNMFIQGHSPMLGERGLSAYLCAGPKSDHEVSFGLDARERLRLGMSVDARESSIAQNLSQIIPAVKDLRCPPNLTFCTDDREPDDLLNEGHMNYVVRRAIEEGLDAIDAVRSATLNGAKSTGIENLGAIAPGYAADLILLPSIEEMKPEFVFCQGKLAAAHGRMAAEIELKDYEVEKKNTVHVSRKLTARDFMIKAPMNEGTVRVNVISYASEDSLIAEFVQEEVPVHDGFIDISGCNGLNYVAVINRHGKNNNFAIGIIRGFGIKDGAVASTVSHDSHNLTAAAKSPEDAASACNALIECGGGLACSRGGSIISLLELPIAGLISPLPVEDMAAKTKKFKSMLKEMGIPGQYPLLRIATIALPVIPEAKITDMGLISVNDQKLVPLFSQYE